ncbi:MAG: hypothetical protein R3B72_50170 [Polyangiaceae bacterium]
MQSQLVRTGHPQHDHHQANQLAEQLRRQGLAVRLVPDPGGGVWVQSWPSAPVVLPPAQRPSALRSMCAGLGNDIRGFNVAAAFVAGLVTLPVVLVGQVVRFETWVGMVIASPIALGAVVVMSRLASARWWYALSGAVVGVGMSVFLMGWAPGPAFATVYVDNRGDDTLHVFADGERVATVEGGKSDEVKVSAEVRRIGWGGTKKKAEHHAKARLVEGGGYLLAPKPGRCYMLVSATYSVSGMATSSDAVTLLPDERFQALPADPNFTFHDLPKSVTVESDHFSSVFHALRRSLTCDELAACKKSVRDELMACYGRSRDQEDAIACEAAARASCGSRGSSRR